MVDVNQAFFLDFNEDAISSNPYESVGGAEKELIRDETV